MFNIFSSRRPTANNYETPNNPPSVVEGAPIRKSQPINPTAHQPTIAELIDANFAEKEAEGADKALHDSNRNLKFRPDITANDKEWIDFRTSMITELAGRAVNEILEDYFEEGQRLLIIPPLLPGAILDVQKRNGKEYTALLSKEGRFARQPNNLVTKLTMLKFGFPVAALTMQNILRKADEPQQDDPPDDPEDIPRVQRTEFAEKPLEFLDVYNERSYGWKILRRKTSSQPLAQEDSDHESSEKDSEQEDEDMNEDPEASFGGISSLKLTSEPEDSANIQGNAYKKRKHQDSIQQTRYIGVIRGGAGLTTLAWNAKDEGHIYSHYGGRAKVSNDVASFVENALKLLGIDPKSDWKFMVDQYNNQTPHKASAGKPLWKQGSQRSTTVTKDDQSAWEMSIRPRVMHPNGDWMMVVVPARPPGAFPKDHLLAVKQDGLGNLPSHQNTSPTNGTRRTPNASETANLILGTDVPTGGTKKTATIYNPEFSIVEVQEDNLEAFLAAALPLAGIDPEINRDWQLHVSFYTPDANSKRFTLHNFVRQSNMLGDAVYRTHIAPKLFSPVAVTSYRVIVHLARENPPKEFPLMLMADQNRKGDDTRSHVSIVDRENVIGAYANEKSITLDDNDSFVKDALGKLGLSANKHYKFSVDRYSRKPNETKAIIEDSLVFTPKSSVTRFDQEIAAKIQDTSKDWFFVARRTEQEPSIQFEPPNQRGTIYGHGGKLLVDKNPNSILQAAQQLLGFGITSDWSFWLDIHGDKPSTHHVTQRNYSATFHKVIEPLLEGDDLPIFVRDGGSRTSTLEPPETQKDVIYLNYPEIGIAYWKIPLDMKANYGLNQTQESFFRAMRILFPEGYPRPNQSVLIEGVDIGFGGMEVSPELWAKVKESAQAEIDLNPNAPESFEYHISFQNFAPDVDNVIGIRLVGSHHFAKTIAGDYQAMMAEIIGLGSYVLADSKNPSQFRIWKTAEIREAREKGKLLKYGEGDADITALEDWFNSAKGSTNCVQFRPEWSTFRLHKLGDDSAYSEGWDAETDPTLTSFRTALNKLFKGSTDLKTSSIVVTEAQSQRRFVLASNITEEEWRKHVYDWFSTARLEVKLVDDIPYTLDTSTPWGLPQRTRIIRADPSQAKALHNISGNAIKFNRDRANLAHTEGRKVAPSFNVYMGHQHYLDDKQQNTYLYPQSVFEPGRKPDAPLFAESKELAIAVGLHTPTVYGQAYTQTDVQHLHKQNRKLLNQVLERMINCNICDTSFKAYEAKEVHAHYAHHQREIASAGDCVICGDKNWKFWDAKQKREHFYYHQARDEGATAKRFWASFECPGCDTDLSKLGDKDQVLNHVISHDPLTVKFCDLCAKSYKYCSAEELLHHQQVCIESPEKGPNDPDYLFCKHCGTNMTVMTDKQSRHHQRYCKAYVGNKFCTECGFGIAGLSPFEIARHAANCKPPGGIPRTYCKRCGINVASLVGDDLFRHSRNCKSPVYNEPAILVQAKQKFDEINALISANTQKDAKRHAEIAVLRQGQEALKRAQLEHNRKTAILQKQLAILRSTKSISKETQAALAHLETGQEISTHHSVDSFKCPLTITYEDGRHGVCGHTLRLANGGTDLIAHYTHLNDVHPEPTILGLGPNAAKFKRMREELERETASFDRFTKRVKRGNAKDNAFATSDSELAPEARYLADAGDEEPETSDSQGSGLIEDEEEPDMSDEKDFEKLSVEKNVKPASTAKGKKAATVTKSNPKAKKAIESEGSWEGQDNNTTGIGIILTESGRKKGAKYFQGQKTPDSTYKQPKKLEESTSSEDTADVLAAAEELVSPVLGKKKRGAAAPAARDSPSKKQKTAAAAAPKRSSASKSSPAKKARQGSVLKSHATDRFASPTTTGQVKEPSTNSKKKPAAKKAASSAEPGSVGGQLNVPGTRVTRASSREAAGGDTKVKRSPMKETKTPSKRS